MKKELIDEMLRDIGLEHIEPFEPLPVRKREPGKNQRIIDEVLDSIGLEHLEPYEPVGDRQQLKNRSAPGHPGRLGEEN